MNITQDQIQKLKLYPNSIYEVIKVEFLYHSNKLEGSTFTRENINKFLDSQIIEGSHRLDDIIETVNSLGLFDFIIDTLGEPMSKKLLFEYHLILKNNSVDKQRGFAGCYKKIPNMLRGSDIQLAQPYEVEEKINELIQCYYSEPKTLETIVEFHCRFEQIHPFQDGNGRIGRCLILKQCIENEIDLVAIDYRYNDEYKKALAIAQKTKDMINLIEVFRNSQKFLEDKNDVLVESLKYL